MDESGVLYYYRVYFNTPLENFFTYFSRLPDLIHKRVSVSLRNRMMVGFVSSHTEKPKGIVLKEIVEVLDDEPVITEEQKELAFWISKQYLSSFGEALGLFFSFTSTQYVVEEKLNNKKINSKTKTHLSRIKLNTLQEKKFRDIKDKLNDFFPILVHGVTGSGKTFFYFKIVEKCFVLDEQALILVPEVTLIFQIYELCLKIFPEIEIGVYHSKLTDKQRYKIRWGVEHGKIRLIIATRSGFFLPYKNLGVIVIDEEHENSYKNNSTPRYQLKQVAYHWAKIKKIPVVFVSATPTVELFYQTEIGAMAMVELTERYAGVRLPQISFLSQEGEEKEEEKISKTVYREVFTRLESGKQVLFYINQRGYSSTVVCKDCKKYYQCPNCEITLTFHKKKNILICHYCGYKEIFNNICQNCGEGSFRFIKAGTENFFEQLEKRFASYQVTRFDSDTVNSTGKIKEILEDFKNNKIHILVGTQMIIKGHDFKNLALVVVLSPEKYLLLPDYRNGERMFAHIVQVAGRAGRDKKTGLGHVIVETDIPHHYALQAAEKQSYHVFYQQEIVNRKAFFYPPFCKLIRLVFRGRNHQMVIDVAHNAKEEILKKFSKSLVLLGPSPCLLEKHNNYYRWNILLKLKKQNYFLNNIKKTELTKNKNVYMEIDVSPVDLF